MMKNSKKSLTMSHKEEGENYKEEGKTLAERFTGGLSVAGPKAE